MSRVKEIKERSTDRRRELQYKVLKDWDMGKLTGLDCIQRIIDLEKIVPLNKDIILGDQSDE